MRRSLLLASFIVLGCVLPADEPTGLELSWRMQEANVLDGEEAQRLRTCSGAFVDELTFWITDAGDPDRSEIFRYDCAEGYQTPAEFQTEASDAFIELKPRRYEIIVDLAGAVFEDEQQDDQDEPNEFARRVRELSVEVLGRTITQQDFDFGLEPVTAMLTIEGQDVCDTVALSMRYTDPERDLAEPPRGEDGQVLDVLYRESLATDQGLSMSGVAASCADLATTHLLDGVDPGAYTLIVDVDGVTCPVPMPLGPRGGAYVIDLANLPCDG